MALLALDGSNYVASIETGHVFVPKTPETFTYEADGNLTLNGRWNYTWDAENRLIKVESRPDTPSSSWRRIEWTYDAFGRRIQQVTSIWTNNAWFVVENLKFVSDPMLFGRHIVELNSTNNTLVRSYAWGLDMSGTMDSAGGVGGLIVTVIHTGTKAGTYFPMYDGNGNVMGYIRAGDGALVAQYEYGPFGELIRASCPLARSFNILFSTKYHEWETDHYYYGYRYYNPNTGRWPNRDSIEEEGGINIYNYVGNNPITFIDPLGLEKDAACVNQCYEDLQDCYSAANIVEFGLCGGAIGAGLQGLNKTATVPGKGRLLGGGSPSGDYTSWTRKCFGRAGRAVGRISVSGAGAIGTGVGMLGLHAKCLSAYAGCMSGCPDKTKTCSLGPTILIGPWNCSQNSPPYKCSHSRR